MMDKKKFEEELKTVSNQVNKDVVKSILSDSISNEFGQPIGQRNLIIVMEELAELSQAVAKELRMKGDKINLLEEMADVQLADILFFSHGHKGAIVSPNNLWGFR